MRTNTLPRASACGHGHGALGLVLLGAVVLSLSGDRRAGAGEPEAVPKQRKPFDGVVLSVAFSPDGKTLAAGGGGWAGETGDDMIKLWDARSGKELATF